MTDGILLGTVPAGSVFDRLDDGTPLFHLPDGSTQIFRISLSADGLTLVVDKIPPLDFWKTSTD